MITMARKILALSPIFFIVSCASYTDSNKAMRVAFYDQDYETALEKLDDSSISSSKTDLALYKMERGMIFYVDKKYTLAATEWDLADRRIEQLYTTSISKTAASFFTNDSVTDYTGEAHERVLLSVFSAIGFFAAKDLNNAAVMIRKSNEVVNYLSSENQGKNLFKRDVFTHYFSGCIWEAKQDWDSAIIEYTKALSSAEAILNEDYGKADKNSSKELIVEIALALGRLAEFRNRSDILERANTVLKEKKWAAQSDLLKGGEIFVIYESGKSPIKVAKSFPIVVGKNILKISFPAYKEIPYVSHSATVNVDNRYRGRTLIAENIGVIAQQALEDRRVRDFVKMSARLVAKQATADVLHKNVGPIAGLAANVYNYASEEADTRSWTTLPDTIQILRIPVSANKEHQVTIVPDAGESVSYSVTLKPGEKKLVRLRTFD